MLTLLALALAQDAPEAPSAPTAAALSPAAPIVPVLTRREPSASLEGNTVPFRLALVPGIGIGANPNTSVEGFSTGVIAHGVDLIGVDAQMAGSWHTGRVEGVQTALGYAVANEVHGVQATLGVNWARGSVDVGQFTLGANVAEGELEGAQVSLGLNIARESVDGLQATTGLNIAGADMEGAQLNTGLNIVAGHMKGVQATTGVNVASDMEGTQIGSLNIAGGMKGAQIGLMNVGNEVKGLQLGLVNVAKTSDVSIAPINLIGDGLHRVDVWASESAVASVAAKIGSKNVYTLGGVGWVGLDQPWWTFGGGFGAHLQKERVWVEIDASAWAIAKGIAIVPGIHSKLRTQVGLEVTKAFQPFAGLSLNHWVGIGQVRPIAKDLPSHVSSEQNVVMWPGAHLGVSF